MSDDTQEAPTIQANDGDHAVIEADAGQQTDVQSIPPEVETRAREMGWVPKDEWRGSPETWREADEFVRRGEEVLPIVRSERDRLKRELEETKRANDERFAKLERMNDIALKRQREMLEKQYEAAQRKAVALGDTDLYDNLAKDREAELKALEEAHAAPKDEPTKTAAPPPEAVEWAKANAWFNKDRAMSAYAVAELDEVSAAYPAWSLADQLKEVSKRVKQRFPEKFGAAPARPAAVESGSRVGGGGTAGRLAAKLPAEARAQGEKFVAEGLFKSLEDYAKGYFAGEAA